MSIQWTLDKSNIGKSNSLISRTVSPVPIPAYLTLCNFTSMSRTVFLGLKRLIDESNCWKGSAEISTSMSRTPDHHRLNESNFLISRMKAKRIRYANQSPQVAAIIMCSSTAQESRDISSIHSLFVYEAIVCQERYKSWLRENSKFYQ